MMKLNFTFFGKKTVALAILTAGILASKESAAQISTVCTNPANIIYGLTGNGLIYEININTAATGAVIKNGTYSGSSPSSANGMGYNYVNGRFYYFKRNVTSSPQQFVSFNPATNTVSTLANSPCADDVHTGCMNHTGTGYYTVDVTGRLYYYRISTNTWTLITSTITDQNNNDVDQVIRDQSAGDMAIDGYGHIWLLTSSDTKYALYEFPTPLPTTPVASLKVTRIISPSTSTPSGQSFAGIAFNQTGTIYLATKNGNRLYRMNDNLSLSFIGTMPTSDVGNDLTSCSFPMGVLPVTWLSFNVSAQASKVVKLDWEVVQENVKGFYIQHSQDGNKWNEIAFVTAKDGHVQSYSYTYMNNVTGKHYYRLRQVDIDDRESYSDVRTVTLGSDKQTVSIWPNPASDQIQISSDGASKAQVFDLSGRILTEKKLQSSVINTVDISMLPKGMYIVKVESSNGSHYNQKISKQ